MGFRGVPRPGTGADAEGDAATVAERGTPGVDALTGVLAFDVRRHGLRFAFALPTERMDAASESPGTCSVENVGAVELIRMSAIVGMSCSCSLNPVGESTRRGLSLGTSYSLDWGDLGRVGHWHAIHEWSYRGPTPEAVVVPADIAPADTAPAAVGGPRQQNGRNERGGNGGGRLSGP